MAIIVNDKGFTSDDWAERILSWDELPGVDLPANAALDVPNSLQVEDMKPLLPALAMIRIDFPSSADGRGFSIARHLRLLGYTGRLRAKGHVLADQYAMARRSGFDEVEIDEALAKRQPEAQWLARANWQENDYQTRLGRTG